MVFNSNSSNIFRSDESIDLISCFVFVVYIHRVLEKMLRFSALRAVSGTKLVLLEGQKIKFQVLYSIVGKNKFSK